MRDTIFADIGEEVLSNQKIMGFPRNDFITKATELGRSSDFIKEALAYASNLDDKGLPVIFNQCHMSFMLCMEHSQLRTLAHFSSCFYRYFAIKKRSGGLRRIMSPYRDLREVQTWIKENILDKVEQPDYVTAFVKGRNTLGNAKMHEGRKFILKVDIANFFESIGVRSVYKAFKKMGYDNSVAAWLANLCTAKIDEYKYRQLEDQEEIQKLFDELYGKEEPFLTQGAPTSPGLANIICARMDKRMIGLANKLGFNYSRYADDMTFSANRKEDLPKIGMIRKIVESEGFRFKEDKTKLLHEGNRQIVTGLLVDGKVRVPGSYKKGIMRHIYFCQKWGGRDHFNRIAPGKAYGKEWLAGRIRYVHSVEPEVAKKMWTEFEKIDWGY